MPEGEATELGVSNYSGRALDEKLVGVAHDRLDESSAASAYSPRCTVLLSVVGGVAAQIMTIYFGLSPPRPGPPLASD